MVIERGGSTRWSTDVSSNGDDGLLRCLDRPALTGRRADPRSACPASVMIVPASAKSVDQAQQRHQVGDPLAPCRRASSATRNASTMVVSRSSTDSSRLFGMMTISVSTCLPSFRSRPLPPELRREPSKPNGDDANRQRAIPRAICRRRGSSSGPVPPPAPAVTNTMSDPFMGS